MTQLIEYSQHRDITPEKLDAHLKTQSIPETEAPTSSKLHEEVFDYLKKTHFGKNYRFIKEHKIGHTYVDIVCAEEKLCIQVNGPIHYVSEHLNNKSQFNQALLKKQGWTVLIIKYSEWNRCNNSNPAKLRFLINLVKPYLTKPIEILSDPSLLPLPYLVVPAAYPHYTVLPQLVYIIPSSMQFPYYPLPALPQSFSSPAMPSLMVEQNFYSYPALSSQSPSLPPLEASPPLMSLHPIISPTEATPAVQPSPAAMQQNYLAECSIENSIKNNRYCFYQQRSQTTLQENLSEKQEKLELNPNTNSLYSRYT